MTDEPKPEIELPGEFERRLGRQYVKEGIEKNNTFFNDIAERVKESVVGTEEEQIVIADFVLLFGQNFAKACAMHNSVIKVQAYPDLAPYRPGKPKDKLLLRLRLFSANYGIPSPVLNEPWLPRQLLTEYIPILTVSSQHVPKFGAPRATKPPQETLHEFYSSEQAKLDAKQVDGLEILKWADRILYTKALGWTVLEMAQHAMIMDLNDDTVTFEVYQNLPGKEVFNQVTVTLELGLLSLIGEKLFEKEIHRHPNFRTKPPPHEPETSEEMPVETEQVVSRNPREVINKILNEIPDDVDVDLASGLIDDLDELAGSIDTNPSASVSQHWQRLSDIMNQWLPPQEIVQNEWMVKAAAHHQDQSPEMVLEKAQKYVEAQNNPEVSDE
jgi:hypothetical protein